MYTIYQITPPHMTTTKIKEFSSVGEARKEMNSLKSASKSSLFGIWDNAGRMYSSMLNK